MIWNLLVHQWRKAAEYIFTVCMGIAVDILIFPASLNHIFMGQQGRSAFMNAANGIDLFLERFRQYRDIVISEFIYPFCVLITVAIVAYLIRQLGKERLIWIVTGVCLVFMLQAYAFGGQ